MKQKLKSFGVPIGQVRIIGGRWRNTRLLVSDKPGLRPSSDRVRETLFNWLQPVLPGARVLDLFAGSGALGLEAVSRGATQAQLIEYDLTQVRALQATLTRLHATEQVQVIAADALHWLETVASAQADIVFIDPPFNAQLWQRVLERLPRHLNPLSAWIYLETPNNTSAPFVPADWFLHRQGRTRQVRYALYRRVAATLRPAPDVRTDP